MARRPRRRAYRPVGGAKGAVIRWFDEDERERYKEWRRGLRPSIGQQVRNGLAVPLLVVAAPAAAIYMAAREATKNHGRKTARRAGYRTSRDEGWTPTPAYRKRKQRQRARQKSRASVGDRALKKDQEAMGKGRQAGSTLATVRAQMREKRQIRGANPSALSAVFGEPSPAVQRTRPTTASDTNPWARKATTKGAGAR